MKKIKAHFSVIIVICIVGIVIYKSLSGIIFFSCLIMEDEGKLDDWDNVSSFVIENQDSLNNIVNEVLGSEMNIVIEQDEIIALDNAIIADETLLQNEKIAWLFEDEYVKEISIKEIQGCKTIIFTTYMSGIVGSSQKIGFYYRNEDLEENEYTKEQKILSNWCYFEEWD